MPTGLTDSQAVIGAGFDGMRSKVAQPAINRSVSLIFATTGIPQPVPGLSVPTSATVRIRAGNGAPTGNAAPCRVALYREALSGNGGDVLTPDTEIIYPIENLAQIWAAGTAGDGIVISIRANATD